MSGIERQLDIGGVRAGDFAKLAAGDRGDVVEVAARDRFLPLATNAVAVLCLVRVFDDLLIQQVIPPKRDPDGP